MADFGTGQNEIVARVPDRFEYLESEGRIGFFPASSLFTSGILENPDSNGGGANVHLTITVNAPPSAATTSDYVARTNRVYNTTIGLTAAYVQRTAEMTISQFETSKIDAAAKAKLAFIDKKIYNITTQAQIDIETSFWQATSESTTHGGPKTWLSGAAYLSATRADTVYDYVGGTSNVSLTHVLGTGSAYDYATYDTTKPTRYETYWDASVGYAGAADQGAFLAQGIQRMQWHINRGGQKGNVTHLCMSKLNASILTQWANENARAAVQYGMLKNLTATGGTDDYTFNGMKLYSSELILDTDIFLINKNYTYVPALSGFSPKTWSREQGPSPTVVQATAFTFATSFKFVTDAPIMHGWFYV